jgi:hypothetical protein
MENPGALVPGFFVACINEKPGHNTRLSQLKPSAVTRKLRAFNSVFVMHECNRRDVLRCCRN